MTRGGVRFSPGNGRIVIRFPDHEEGLPKSGAKHGVTHVKIPPPPSGATGGGGGTAGRFAQFKEKYYPSQKDQIKVLPNPVDDVLTLRSMENIVHVDIYNSFGIKVQQTNYKQSSNNITMDCNSMKRGLYTLKIYTADGAVHTKRIIKN